jgi:hypothetical protein
MDKSFLVLFFKKERFLSSCPLVFVKFLQNGPTRLSFAGVPG